MQTFLKEAGKVLYKMGWKGGMKRRDQLARKWMCSDVKKKAD